MAGMCLVVPSTSQRPHPPPAGVRTSLTTPVGICLAVPSAAGGTPKPPVSRKADPSVTARVTTDPHNPPHASHEPRACPVGPTRTPRALNHARRRASHGIRPPETVLLLDPRHPTLSRAHSHDCAGHRMVASRTCFLLPHATTGTMGGTMGGTMMTAGMCKCSFVVYSRLCIYIYHIPHHYTTLHTHSQERHP
jgi:hypothetical protein